MSRVLLDGVHMLFAAHRDRDPLRIDFAIRHLRFIVELQGLPAEHGTGRTERVR